MNQQVVERIASVLATIALVAVLAPSAPGQRPATMTVATGCQPAWLPTFGGIPGLNGEVRALAQFDDGTGPAMFAAGNFTLGGGQYVNGIAKWDGSRWSALGGGLQEVYALAVYDDGSGSALYAAGAFTVAGGAPGNRIAKWNGSSWSPLLGGLNSGNVYALGVFNDGTGSALYAGGQFTTAGIVSANHIARWNGTSWSALGSGVGAPNEFVASMAVFDDGTGSALYVGGQFGTAGGVLANSIARWSGATWSDVAGGATLGGPPGWVYALTTYNDGSGQTLVAGGSFNMAGTNATHNIARWNGSAWLGFNSGVGNLGGDAIRALSVFDSGSGTKLYAGGRFGLAGGVSAYNFAAWDGSTWNAPPGLGPDVFALAVSGIGSGSRLFVGSTFGLAAWNGVSWTNGVNGTSHATAVYDDGSGPSLVVAGSFTTAGNIPANRIASWNGATWTSLGSGLDAPVRAVAVFDDGSGPALYAGGDFAGHVARWDGVSWATLGAGLDNSVFALAVYDDGQGPALYAGGYFQSSGGTLVRLIAKWNGSTWGPVGAGISTGGGSSPVVLALTSYDDGTGTNLYAGGIFLDAGGTPAVGIAQWDGANWSAVGSGFSGYTQSLAVYDDGHGAALYAGGSLSAAGGAAIGIARWDGTTWSALGSGANNYVRALTAFDDGTGSALIAGGSFTSVGGVAVNYIAKWDGTTWSPIGNGMNNIVMTLTTFNDGSCEGPALFAGGDFTQALDSSDSYLARWVCSGQAAAPGCMEAFCFGDGVAIACPCNNTGGPAVGCANSSGQGAILATSGFPSLTNDSLVLTSYGELPSVLSIFVESASQVVPVRFGDGARCFGSPFKRLYSKSAVAGAATAPGPGEPSVSARSAALGDPLSVGAIRYYQTYYRDPAPTFCPSPAGNTFNVSSGLIINWAP